jgi:tripartite-type tricarboxylate transporter receptor subunit TctC
LGIELLRTMTGITLVHVPYKGTGPALTAMLAGEIHFQLIGISSVVPHIKAGRMRALAVSGSARSSAAPDVPTVAESGVPGYDFDVWYGMLFPAGTPQRLIEQANRDIRRALQSASLQQRFAGLGVQTSGNSADEFRKLIASEVEKWNKVVAAANIKLH